MYSNTHWYDADAERIGVNYVEVDFYGALSIGDLTLRMEEAYARLRSPLRRAAISAIGTLRPRLSVGAGPLRVEAQPVREGEAARILAGLLDLPRTLFERDGTRTLVVFDEFQELLAVGAGVDGLFRAHIQRHGDAASYIFAGSHPGMMQQLFGERERPFFDQARVFHLDPLQDADLVEYVGSRFEDGNRDATPVLEPLAAVAGGHPQRAMLLAHHLWELTPRGEEATPERWQEALETALEERREAFGAVWDGLSRNEQAVLAAFAHGDESLFNERTLRRFNLSKGGAQHARETLAGMGHLQRLGGEWHAVDPLLSEWVVRLGLGSAGGRRR